MRSGEGTLPESRNGATRESGCARTFWWDRARPGHAHAQPLRAVIFGLDALADIERDGHRVAFNSAFAAHGLDIVWTAEDYGRLLRIRDEERRIASDLRRRGFGGSAGRLAARLHHTKTELLDDCVIDNVTQRPGLVDLVMSLFVAGIAVGVVTTERGSWIEPLVRQLVGDGLYETLVTADDVTEPGCDPDVHGQALWEMGIAPESALAIEGTARGLQAAAAAKLPTVVVTSGAPDHFSDAAQVRSSFDGAEPLRAAGCERIHRRWWTGRKQTPVSPLATSR